MAEASEATKQRFNRRFRIGMVAVALLVLGAVWVRDHLASPEPLARAAIESSAFDSLHALVRAAAPDTLRRDDAPPEARALMDRLRIRDVRRTAPRSFRYRMEHRWGHPQQGGLLVVGSGDAPAEALRRGPYGVIADRWTDSVYYWRYTPDGRIGY